MFFKLINEDGIYTKNNETVNLVYGNDIHTPNGKVSSSNLQGYFEFETLEEALTYFNLEAVE